MKITDINFEASAFSDVMVKAAAYTRIRQEIKALAEKTLEWKRRYNTLSSISRLPPEILSTIFECVTEETTISSCRRWFHWIRVTHVCSHWRNVALECPRLWTSISSQRLPLMLEMLKRSKMAPLNVVLNLGSDSVLRVMEEIFRIRKLSLVATGYSSHLLIPKVFSYLTADVAPLLESLMISFGSGSQTNILPEIIPQASQRLRILDLRNCDLHWNSPFLYSLTSLRIDTITPALRPSTSELIAVLANISNLENLKLTSVLRPPPDSEKLMPPGRIVGLVHLKNLHLDASAKSCASFLIGLTYPITATIGIHAAYVDQPDYTSNLQVDELAQVLRLKTYGPIRRLDVSQGFLRVTTPGQSLDLSSTLFVSVPSRHMGSLRMFWKGLQLQDLECLHLHDTQFDKADWLQCFGSLKRLKSINVSNSLRNFISALSTGTTIIDDPGRLRRGRRLRFQALRRLEIVGLEFDMECGRFEDYHARLCRILRERRQRGVVLRELHLSACRHIQLGNISNVEAIVKNVQWDGDEGYTEEEDSEDDDEAYSDGYGGYGYW